MTNYTDFLQFQDDFDGYYRDDYLIDGKNKQAYLLEMFLSKKYEQGFTNSLIRSIVIEDRYFDLGFTIIHDFPSQIILPLVSNYVHQPDITVHYYTNIEVIKYIYSNWRNKSFDVIKKIKSHLHSITTAEHISWWLCCFLPLLHNGKDLILTLIRRFHLFDTQHLLLYGIYHIDVPSLGVFFKDFLIELNKQNQEYYNGIRTMPSSFDIRESIYEIGMILNKLWINNIKLLDDPVIIEILDVDYDIIREAIITDNMRLIYR